MRPSICHWGTRRVRGSPLQGGEARFESEVLHQIFPDRPTVGAPVVTREIQVRILVGEPTPYRSANPTLGLAACHNTLFQNVLSAEYSNLLVVDLDPVHD